MGIHPLNDRRNSGAPQRSGSSLELVLQSVGRRVLLDPSSLTPHLHTV